MISVYSNHVVLCKAIYIEDSKSNLILEKTPNLKITVRRIACE